MSQFFFGRDIFFRHSEEVSVALFTSAACGLTKEDEGTKVFSGYPFAAPLQRR